MAILKIESSNPVTDLNQIRTLLSDLKIELSHWPIQKNANVTRLLQQNNLNPDEKELLLKELDSRFEEQKKKFGYQTRDLVVLHSETEKLSDMLKIFDKCHTHSDDEVRYIIDGSGVFGFVLPDGKQALLTVNAEEYIRVPANTEHWFVLTAEKRIKAVRYFTSKEGWVANYTGTPVRI